MMRSLSALAAAAILFGFMPAHGAEVSLEWSAPTQNVDGSQLTDLAGFLVYVYQQPGEPGDPVLNITDPTATTTVVSIPLDLIQGNNTVYAAMRAYNDQGVQSFLSNEVQEVIIVSDQPNAPLMINIEVTITVDCPPNMNCTVE